MRLAIFGGTFDPVHNAHLTMARHAAESFQLDRVLFVPAGRPPHKTIGPHAAYEHRFRMVEIACAGESRFEPSRLEQGTRNSYSIETIEKIRATMPPDARLFFILGADAFSEIRTWYRWLEVGALVDFIVVSRPGHVYDVPEGFRAGRLDGLNLEISSSDVRHKLARGEDPPEVPPAVLAYIRQHGLYAGGAE